MKLIVMAFNGEYKMEQGGFKTVDDAWARSNDMGSRWYFYPFHFVVSASGKTIIDAPELLEWTKGRRVNTVQRIFEKHSGNPETQGMDAEQFALTL